MSRSGIGEGCTDRKRLKSPAVVSEEGIDRISELPEALIIDILSLLPTRDNIRTGALAKKWRGLWTRVPYLYFKDDFLHKKSWKFPRSRRFVEYVNETLTRFSGGSKVRSLVVKWANSDYDPGMDLWTRFAVENEIEKFELEYDSGCQVEYHPLPQPQPQLLFTNSSFKELRFRSWNSLKTLTMLDPALDDESLEKILAGVPALERLNLQLTSTISSFHLGSGLKKLTLTIEGWDIYEDEVAWVEISAPNVQSLEISGYYDTCKLLDMAYLIEATIFVVRYTGYPEGGYPILTQEILSSLLNVQTLTLGTWIIQGIAMLPVDHRPLFSKCKCLTLDTHLWKEEPSAIASLLKNTPEIEILMVTMDGFCSKYEDPSGGYDISYIDQYWTSQEMASDYLARLRTVKFMGFWAYRTVAFPFVEFLLKNARGLKKVIIHLKTIQEIDPIELFGTSQKLLSFPRSSPDAKLMIYL